MIITCERLPDPLIPVARFTTALARLEVATVPFMRKSASRSLTRATARSSTAGGSEVAFMAGIENVDIEPDTKAKIIIDERTGTVVMGSDVRLKPIAVAHGNLNVEVKDYENAASPLDNINILAKEQGNKLAPVNPGATLGELVTALNVIGVTPRDLIAILQSIKAAGALEASLEII